MKRALSLALSAACVAFLTVAGAPGVAHAATSCVLGGPIGYDHTEVHVADQQTIGLGAMHVSICNEWYGDGDFTHIPQWASPRIVPGTCEPSTVHDPLCFTLYVDSAGMIGYSSWTVAIHGEAGPDLSWTIPVPPEPALFPRCLLSMGYPAAPTRDCDVVYDMGQ